ncbi:HIT family protein [Cupriavidus pinatubonensis]|nr:MULTISPECIES: HIT family protein [Cupriavidus]TPQ43718.1 HIT family protein [Cupriavidus pinatubonensis]
MTRMQGCPLCEADGGELVWMGDRARVILVEHDRFPGFCRIVWNDHAAELTDLDETDQAWLMRLVARVERLVREVMTPDKVNLAAFGNMVPHLHWHIIPRYRWDTHFPEAIWAAPQRAADPARMAELASRLPALRTALSALAADS